jgi:U2 small nuclear ribonucleoprotein B''
LIWGFSKKKIKKFAGGDEKIKSAMPASDVGEPNSILFLENLPEATTEAMLGVLFQQFPG